MITRGSALYKAATNNAELSRQRSKMLIDLCRSRVAFAELAIALNCPEAVVRSLLAYPFRSLCVQSSKADGLEVVELDRIPQAQRCAAPDPGSRPEQVINDEREKLTHKVAIEIHRWLASFQASDGDRQQAIEKAGHLLDERTTDWEGKYVFPSAWLVLDSLGVMKSVCPPQENRDFRSIAGPWLANWIHFWVADPIIWNRALDLEFAYFGAKAQPA